MKVTKGNGDNMYRMLESRLAFHGINKKKMAEETGINYNTLLSKIASRTKFSLDEAILIKQYLNETMPIEELFKDED